MSLCGQPGLFPCWFQALRQRSKLLILGSGATCIHNGKPITRSKWEMLGRPKQVKWEADFTFETLQIKFHESIQFDLVNKAVINFGGVMRQVVLSIVLQQQMSNQAIVEMNYLML